jgi:hypothetical protein
MYTDRYRTAFAALDLPLQPEHGMDAATIALMPLEGLRLPKALAEYYAVAGNELVLNQCYDRLLPPDEVFVESGRIAFMEENQVVVYWGVRGLADDSNHDSNHDSNTANGNPPLEQGANNEGEPIDWYSELTDCASFLITMLYWHASFGGGLEFCGSAVVAPDLKETLEQRFDVIGTIDTLTAYGRKGCALSFSKMFDDEYQLFAGFSTEQQKLDVSRELNVTWEDD